MKKLKVMVRFFLITTVFISFYVGCKQPNKEENLISKKLYLTELKVDGAIKAISDSIDAGKTKKEKVLIETKTFPMDANVDYVPALEGGQWKLSIGQNVLKIKLKKGSDEKEYNVAIERLEEDRPILKRLTIGTETKEGSEIASTMSFTAPEGANSVEVKTETDPIGVNISFDPALNEGKLELKSEQTSLKIVLGDAPKTTEYNVTITRQDIKLPHLKMYGYFLRGKDIGGFGFGEFYLDKLQDVKEGSEHFKLIYPYKQPLGVYAGAVVDNVYYAAEYVYNAYGPPSSTDLVAYDISTGTKTTIGEYAKDNNQFRLQGMAYDYSSKKMYGIGFESGNSALYTLDLSTGARHQECVLSKKGVATLAIDLTGNMYTMGQDGILYKINKTTGEMEEKCETDYQGMLNLQSMDFDHTTGLLYWTSSTNSKDNRNVIMVRFDLSKTPIEVMELGNVGDQCNIVALYIPFVKDGVDVPEAPSDFTITPAENGDKKATLKWTNPSKTFDGKPLSSISSITIMRGNVEVATLPTTQIGVHMTYEDSSIPNNGEFRYAIYATNSVGKGEKAYKSAWIGFDSPEAPKDVNIEVGEGCKTATIKWTPPTKGFHGGYFNATGLTYKIIRFPDNEKVAENLTQASFVDNSITTLKRYYYQVFAVNPNGEAGAYSPFTYVLGDAINALPLTLDFEDENEYVEKWTSVDGNNDNYSWTYNSPYGPYEFEDNDTSAEYIINPGVPNTHKDADEWIISPPISFDKTKTYVVRLKMRSISDEEVKVTIGDRNVKEAHQTMLTTLTVKNETTPKPIPMKEYIVEIPANTENVKCIGFHLTTKFPETTNKSHLQIGEITIAEKE